VVFQFDRDRLQRLVIIALHHVHDQGALSLGIIERLNRLLHFCQLSHLAQNPIVNLHLYFFQIRLLDQTVIIALLSTILHTLVQTFIILAELISEEVVVVLETLD